MLPRRAPRAHASAGQPPAATRHRPQPDPRLRERPTLAPSRLSQSAHPSRRASRARRAPRRRRAPSRVCSAATASSTRGGKEPRSLHAIVSARRRAPAVELTDGPTLGFPSASRRSAEPGLRLESRLDRAIETPPPRRLRSPRREMESRRARRSRVTRLARHVEREEVLAGRFRLRLGLRPSALNSQHLRVVDATVASPAARGGMCARTTARSVLSIRRRDAPLGGRGRY